jgi:hypothetical protein
VEALPPLEATETRRALDELRSLMHQLEGPRDELKRVIDGLADQAQLQELDVAMSRGVLRIEDVDVDATDDGIARYLNQIAAHFNDPRAHLLLDDTVGGVVAASAALEDRATRRARQVSVSSELLARLPSFETLTVAEVLDVRADLQPAVVNFRGAVSKFENELVDAPPGGPELVADVYDLWTSTVAPELGELAARIDDNRSLRLLQAQALAEPARSVAPVAAGVIGMFVGPFPSVIPVLFGALGFVGPLGARQKQTARELQRHRLYLLHAVGSATRR